MGQIYLNGEPVDKIPEEALKIMSERLSETVSRYFNAHPDEYEAFLKEQDEKKRLAGQMEVTKKTKRKRRTETEVFAP